MAMLPPRAQLDPTLDAADQVMVDANLRAAPRRYLGMSALGDECSRRLWYRYHQPTQEAFDAPTLRRFADGHAVEAVVIARLRAVPGITLLDVDPDTGRQWDLADFDGQLRGHMDGVIVGLFQSPKTWHCFEVKATNEKSFAKLLKIKAEKGDKQALAAWNPVYAAQAQLYMGYAELTRHYTVVCTPGARDWTSMRTEADPVAFALLRDKADRILHARAPLAKLSNDPAWYACKWCSHHAICHGVAA